MTAFGADLHVVTRQQVAAAVLNSPEYHRDRIEPLYRTLLHGEPDFPGLTSWTMLLQHGMPDEELSAGIRASKESFAGA
jgi:hypothetical protein